MWLNPHRMRRSWCWFIELLDGGLGINERNGAVFHFRREIAFGVDIGNLFEFQRALEGDREGVAAAQEEEIVGFGIFQGQFSNHLILEQQSFATSPRRSIGTRDSNRAVQSGSVNFA